METIQEFLLPVKEFVQIYFMNKSLSALNQLNFHHKKILIGIML